MYRLVILCIFFLVSCTAPNRVLSYTSPTIPVYKIDPPPQKFLLLNTNDVVAKKYRDNKEELFISLTDNLMDWLAEKIKEKTGVPAQVLRGYSNPAGNTDGTVHTLMAQNQASHAVVIHSFDVHFDQTHVDVTKANDGSKDRTAFYDIVSVVSYTLYSPGKPPKNIDVTRKRFHSSRSVTSGLLAAGPNVVSRKDDANNMTIDNGIRYLEYYFPGKASRSRMLFGGKEFKAVSDAIAKNDYEAALIESLRLVDDNNKTIAARACYNCAVLFERKSQPDEAISYLHQSLSRFNLPEAKKMLADYEE
ncbi:MAG TPA: DUF6340 family protein [Chitinophagaceae bacterium]